MSIPRALLVAAGALLAVFVLLFLLRGSSATEHDAAAAEAKGQSGNPETQDRSSVDEEAPRWESYAWSDPAAESLPRPIADFVPTPADPFARALARKRPETVALRLEGLAPGDSPLALISGQVVRIGESVDGFRVSRIGTDSVSLSDATGKHVELSLTRNRKGAR
ncbi:MAG: hypothetical protein AAF657_21980 [Acidobacteriota bacterium]